MLKKFVHIKDLYPVKFVDITGKIYNIDDYKELNYAENHDPMGTFMYTVKLSSETNICTGKVTDRCGDHIGDCASGPHHTWTPFKWILDDSGSYFQCTFDTDAGWGSSTCIKGWQCSISASGEDYYSI